MKENFDLPKISWADEFFERLLKSIKSCLKKLLNFLKIDNEDLLTILVEIMNVLLTTAH